MHFFSYLSGPGFFGEGYWPSWRSFTTVKLDLEGAAQQRWTCLKDPDLSSPGFFGTGVGTGLAGGVSSL